ncbi:MAG: cysteine desulfurase [Polyangiaceae bacterium]
MSLDLERVRADFPILRATVYGRPLVYLDNAATTQKPEAVMRAMDEFYCEYCSNIHRGLHALGDRATVAYEGARRKAQEFFGARESREVIFVRGATEAINLVAQTFGRERVRAGDEILVSAMEHHSNIVPWQLLCAEKGATLKVIPMNDAGELLLDEYDRLLGPKTRLVAIAQVSNALGTVNPVETMIRLAHDRQVPVLVDGAQAAAHRAVDVASLDCEFYVASGHKMFGPTGIGILYGKAALLDSLPPYQTGGEMIASVSFERTTFKKIPSRFEAGTPNIAGAIGLAAAIDYLEGVGMADIAAYEQELLRYATQEITAVPEVRLIGTAKAKASILSFVVGDVHPHDAATILDRRGVAVRAGHHCAEPTMARFDVPATVRASFAFYNTHAEVDALVQGVQEVVEVFQ